MGSPRPSAGLTTPTPNTYFIMIYNNNIHISSSRNSCHLAPNARRRSPLLCRILPKKSVVKQQETLANFSQRRFPPQLQVKSCHFLSR